MSATSEETSNDGGGSNMCFKTDEADMSGVSCARLSSRPESDYWKGFSTSTYSHSRSNHVAFPVPPLRLRSGADPLSVIQDISKGCQAKASQQPESLSRNLTFSFQSGEAKLNVSYLEDVLENDLLQESVINNQHKCNWSLSTLLYIHIVFTFWSSSHCRNSHRFWGFLFPASSKTIKPRPRQTSFITNI